MKRSALSRVLPLFLGAALAALGLPPRPAAAAESTPTLNLYIWANYIPADLLKKFGAECGCKVVETDYNSNGEMIAKLEAGGDSQYDVVVPSDDYIASMRIEGLIRKLDHAKLSNFKNLEPKFQNPTYDPNDQYSIPYQWGTVGIVYDPAKIKNPPESWSLLFDPKVNPDFPFAISKGEGRGQVATACTALGLGAQCDKKAEWIAAAKLIRQTKARPNFAGFVEPPVAVEQMKHGLLAVSEAYNGDVAACHADKSCPGLVYFVPKEGSFAWVDTMAVTAHAPHPELALKFINFILDAQNGAALSKFNQYASPNAAAAPYLKDLIANPIITPTAAVQKRLYFLKPITGADYKLFNQIWTTALQ